MASRIAKAFTALELEERILHAGSIIAIIGVFLPWVSGEWLGGDAVTYTGLQFYTSFLGIAILLLRRRRFPLVNPRTVPPSLSLWLHQA